MKACKKRQTKTEPSSSRSVKFYFQPPSPSPAPPRKLARLRIYPDGFGLQWATTDENGQEVLEPLRDYLARDLAELNSEASRQKRLAIRAEEMGHKTDDFQAEIQARSETSCNQASCSLVTLGEKTTPTQPATVQHL